jgi:c-di-GMP-binding flagellar brake protein YcgR
MLSLPYLNFSQFLPQKVKLPKLGISLFHHPLFHKSLFQSLKFFNKSKKISPAITPTALKEKVLRKVFVKDLIKHNRLRVCLPNGEILTVYATAYDRINNHLVVSDQAEQGLFYLEQGDQVEFHTDLNENHEYYSFVSIVAKIKVKGIKLTYFMSVPKELKKSRRRIIPRTIIKNLSLIRIAGSHFSGRVIDLSANGISLAINGYYPEPLLVGDNLNDCNVDIFQPRVNDNVSFNCSINIKRIDFQSKPERVTIIAGTYINSEEEKEEKIFSFLQQPKHLI